MDFNEMVEKCKAEAKAVKDLKKEIAQKNEALADIVRENYDKFVAPLTNVFYEIGDMAIYNLSNTNRPDFAETRVAEFGDYSLYLNNGFSVFLEKNGDWSNITMNFPSSMNNATTVEHFYSLASTDAAMELADRIKKIIVERLGCVYDCFLKENSKLSETLRKLKEMLENSSTVEQLDENKVRVQIGGKTYIGTLEEKGE